MSCAEFANSSAVSENLGLSPLEIDLGWKSRSSLDMTAASPTQLESLSDFRQRLRSLLQDTQLAHEAAKAKQIAETSVHFKKPYCSVNDRVWISHRLFKDSYSSAQQSTKLSARR